MFDAKPLQKCSAICMHAYKRIRLRQVQGTNQVGTNVRVVSIACGMSHPPARVKVVVA